MDYPIQSPLLPLPQFAPTQLEKANFLFPGLGSLVNQVLAAGIPGISWPTIFLFLLEHGAPKLIEWLKGLLQGQSPSTTSAVPPG